MNFARLSNEISMVFYESIRKQANEVRVHKTSLTDRQSERS